MSNMKFISIFDPKTELDFVGKLKLAVGIAVGIVAVSLLSMPVFGITWGLDFTGGTEMQVKFDKPVGALEVRDALGGAGFDRNQVQQYGPADEHEMLIRIERLTSLTDEHIGRMQSVLEKHYDELRFGSDKPVSELKVEFRPDEGDKISVKLPEPVVNGPAAKNADSAAIDAALQEKLGAGDAKAALDDAAVDALSAAGFDRSAVAARAAELGYPVTASNDKTVEPEFSAVVVKDKLLEQQEALLARILDEESGAKLRRTRAAGETEATYEDSVIRDEPYLGMVKYTVHFRGVSADIEKALREKFGAAEIRRVEFVDAQVAQQLQTDGLLAVLYALLMILVYVAIRFDIFFAPGAVIALLHDAIGAMLLFTLAGVEFQLPSVAALLTVVGYSINNTIVIYDRIRETVPTEEKQPLTDEAVRGYVNKAINDTFSRTINTSLTTLFASLALFFVAGGVVQDFAAVLSLGILLGAFSSTFLAPAMYLWFRRNFRTAEPVKATHKGLSREDKARGVV